MQWVDEPKNPSKVWKKVSGWIVSALLVGAGASIGGPKVLGGLNIGRLPQIIGGVSIGRLPVHF